MLEGANIDKCNAGMLFVIIIYVDNKYIATYFQANVPKKNEAVLKSLVLEFIHYIIKGCVTYR